jgi:chromosome segregation ATPase
LTNVKNEIKNVNSLIKNSQVFNGNIINGKINNRIDSGILGQLNMGYSTDGKMTSGYSDAIDKLSKSYTEATAEANALRMAQDGLSEATVIDILAKQNWSKAEMDAAVSSQAFKNAQISATASTNADTTATWANVAATKALSVAKKATSVIGGMFVTTAITAGVSLLISGIVKLVDNVHESDEEIKEAAANAKKAIDDIKSSFDELESTTNDIKEKYAELAQGVDLLTNKNLTLSTDDYNEFLDLSNQLAELFPTLTKNYDDNGNAILDLSGDVGSIVYSLDELIKRQKQLANEEILENLPSVYKDYSKQVDNYTEKLEEAKKKQNSYQQLYNNIKDTEYEVSEDKHVVTFKLNGLTHKEQADTLKYLTDNIEDINHALTQNIDEETTTITLYLDTEFNGFDARLESAQDDIRKYTDKIKEETSSFSTYINTWLEDSWEFQQIDDTKIQQALKQVLFNKDWIDIAKSELGEDAEWSDIASWMETHYIKAINAIEDEEIKQDFIDLFTLDLTPEATIELAQKIQEHFNNNDIKVSLDFILDEDDPSSTTNIVERVKESFKEATGSIDELEQKYKQIHKARKKAYADSDYVGNVDINNRPIVANSELGGDYQTSYTGFQEYWKGDEKNGHYEIIHFTPILPDGTVLDDTTLYNYLDNVIAKADNALEADKVENGGKGILYKVDTTVDGQKITDSNLDQAFSQAEQWDIEMHEKQSRMYDEEAYALINYNKALEEQNKLLQYFNNNSIDTDQEYEKWLEVTQGVQSAEEKIKKYDEYLASRTDKDYSFFTEENTQKIDDYTSKVNELTEYYNKLHSAEGLSSADKVALNQTYGIARNSSEGYAHAILQEISMLEHNDIAIQTLKEAIENCTDAQEKMRLEALLEYLQNLSKESIKAANGFDNLGNAMSNLKTRADLLREVDENMKEFGKIDTSQLNEILELFPELETQVALYSAGLMDSTKLFNMMTEAYQTDAHLYAEAMAEKLQYNEQFYDNIYDDIPQYVKDLADSYDIDLENYTTLCAAKLDLEAQLAEKRVELYSAITKAYNISRDQYASPEEKAQVQEEYRAVQKEFNDIQSIFDSVKQTTFKQFETSWEKYGKDSDDDDDDDDEEQTTKIDWSDQSLSVLQEKVDDAQTALENTKGLDAQLEAVDTLKTALGELKDGYQEAFEEYETRYTNGLKKVSNPDEIKRKIESGEEFVLDEYPAEEAEVIQELIDLYGKMAEAEDKMAELQLEIDNNENIEKSKFRQEEYEKELESIQEKLKDQTLTVSEKNGLLEEELKYQQLINEEMAKRAEYEGDEKGAATLRKNNENLGQQNENNILQNDIALNDTYIEVNKERLNNPNLTKDEIDFINARDKSLQEQAFDYRFQEIRNTIDDEVWNLYIEDLRKQYNELTLSEEELIDKYFEDIAQYFNYTGMEKLYYEKLNYGIDTARTDYDTNKDISSYYINDNDNQISDIQHDIDYSGGRGTEEQYETMKSLHKENLALLKNQRQEAEKMLKNCTEGTKAWDDWNKEVQECDDKIASVERSIKDCEIAILKLPLNDIQDRLMEIENQLDDINEMIDYNNSYISAANFILDKSIRKHNKEKELIQDQLDALQKVNDARQNSLALQQAEYNLRKAEQQRTSKVFVEGKGWEFQSDPDELNQAQQNYEQALFDNKVFQLNEEIRLHDEEIEKLNRIKEEWSWITTEAQGLVDLNQALLYDLQFEEKVLSGNAALVSSIANNMKVYYQEKKTFEDEQKRYEKLQDEINDTATAYDLEAIDYEEARRRISNAIKQYYPEIFEKYGEESQKIQEIIDKKLEEAGITQESSEDINESVDESNKKLVESYTKLVEDLEDVFKQLNTMLSTYATNAQNMASSVAASIATIKNALNGIDTVSNTVDLEKAVSTAAKAVTSNATKKSKATKTAGKSHSGMELGYIGDGSDSGDKKAFRYIALNELKDDEIVRVLQKGEAVLTSSQVNSVMDNFRKVAEFKMPTLALNNAQPNKSVEFKGDIIINNPVGDSSSLARAIKQNLGNQVLQELYK